MLKHNRGIAQQGGGRLIAASLLFILLVAVAGIWVAGCHAGGGYKKNRSHAEVSDDRIARGEALAVKYCGSCHLTPTPDLLDAGSWEKGVLPQMGPRLGIFEYRSQRYPNNSQDPNVGRDFYPSQPLLTVQQWGDLIDYYTALAPDTLPGQQRPEPLRADTSVFQVGMPEGWAGENASGGGEGGEAGHGAESRGRAEAKPGKGLATAGSGGAPPATCLIRYDSVTRQVLTSDILAHTFNRWNDRLQPLPALPTGGAIVDLARESDGYAACNIGVFAPNNAKAGRIDHIILKGQSGGAESNIAFDGLMRPVNLAMADLNGDGKEDIVVCEFGFIKGALSWLESREDGHWEQHVLRAVPGAIRVVTGDFNHDGLTDILALFAQGEEGIFLYTNQGHGQFAERQVLRFPASYGSTYFELADFNGDGKPDILYTAGDNGDFSTILKPYHGVYLFINDGQMNFTQRYFYPIDGCYRAMARDFNGDGKPDIAAIAYFADFAHQPEEGFVYLQQEAGGAQGSTGVQGYTGDQGTRSGQGAAGGQAPDTAHGGGGGVNGIAPAAYRFSAHSIPGTEAGRWITMDVADLNRDGRPDILLANCSVGPGFTKGAADWKKGPPFMVLWNKGGDKK